MQTPKISELLKKWRGGDDEAFQLCIDLIYKELETLVQKNLKKLPKSGIPTNELLNEVVIRFMRKGNLDAANRDFFLRVAGIAMYRIIVDIARKRLAEKEASDYMSTIDLDDSLTMELERFLKIEEALGKLELNNPSLALIIKLRYFAGYSFEEIAQIMSLSISTVRRKWSFARKAVLAQHLELVHVVGQPHSHSSQFHQNPSKDGRVSENNGISLIDTEDEIEVIFTGDFTPEEMSNILSCFSEGIRKWTRGEGLKILPSTTGSGT